MSLLKKINRGVLLSLAVVLCIAGYYGVREVQIRPEKEALRDLARKFAEVYEEAQLREEPYRGFKEYPDESLKKDAETLRKELSEIYVKDAPGIEKWVQELVYQNPYKASASQYLADFRLKDFKINKIYIKDDVAAVSFEARYDVERRSTGSEESFDTYCSGNMSLVKKDGKWRASAVTMNGYF